MKIVAVSTMRGEQAIVTHTLTHLLRQGVDQIIISVEKDDDSLDLVHDLYPQLRICTTDLPFRQDHEITCLAQMAAQSDADWIIPFDADEFWIGCQGRTVRDILLTSPRVDAVFAPMFLHLTPQLRARFPKPLPKMAFRPNDTMRVAWGSHSVTGWTEAAYGSLEVRELQYRDWDHFLHKIAIARELHSQPHMDHANGSHMWRLCQMTEDELRAEWNTHLQTDVVEDPIPGLEL